MREDSGDVWTWTALDADSKLIVSWYMGDRDAQDACEFMYDVADRLANRVQLTTDGYWAYLVAIDRAFDNDIDFAQLVKMYGAQREQTNQKGNIALPYVLHSVIKSHKVTILPKSIAVCGTLDGILRGYNSIIEAGPDFWLWGTPAGENSYNVNFFCDPESYKDYGGADKFMNYGVSESKLLPLVFESKSSRMCYACPAIAYVDKNVISSRHIKIGDSAYCLDPIASQGIQKAIKSGVHGAAVVNTILSKKDNDRIAIRYYQNMTNSGVHQHQLNAQKIYGEQNIYTNSNFWTSRHKSEGEGAFEKESIKIDLNEKLEKNLEFSEVESGALHDNFIEPIKGVQRSDNVEPFIFLNGIQVEELMSLCHNRSVKECMISFKKEFPEEDPVSLLRWLIFNRLVISAGCASVVSG